MPELIRTARAVFTAAPVTVAAHRGTTAPCAA